MTLWKISICSSISGSPVRPKHHGKTNSRKTATKHKSSTSPHQHVTSNREITLAIEALYFPRKRHEAVDRPFSISKNKITKRKISSSNGKSVGVAQSRTNRQERRPKTSCISLQTTCSQIPSTIADWPQWLPKTCQLLQTGKAQEKAKKRLN